MSRPPRLALIAAVADNGVIGRANRLPWHLPADLAHFKRLTLNKPILMGRRTWESLPGLLPRRRHLVLTRDPSYRADGCTLVHSLDEAIAAAGPVPELLIVGGATLYAEALPRTDRLYLTMVHAEVTGDTRFPAWDPADWIETERVEHPADERNPISMTFLILDRAAGRQGRDTCQRNDEAKVIARWSRADTSANMQPKHCPMVWSLFGTWRVCSRPRGLGARRSS